jgi:hypothetical protein
MKFQINVDEKKVEIVEGGNLHEMVKTLKKFLGEDYDKYDLVVNPQVFWYSYPTIIYRHPYYEQDYTTCETNIPSTGVYNLVVS